MTEGGAIELYNEADWIFGSTIREIPSITSRLFEYNQDEYKQNTCTVYGAMGAWSGTTGKEIPPEKRKEIVDEAIKRGLDVNVGRYVHSAIKLVNDMMGEVSFLSVGVGSDDYRNAIDKGYMLVSGYRGNRTYNTDRDNNGIVDTNNRGRTTYGHIVRHRKEETVIDNYPSRGTNKYKLPQLSEKQKVGGQIFRNAYFYISQQTIPMENLPQHITTGNTEVIKARELEVSQRLKNGGDKNKLYRNYTDADAITKMLMDIKLIRLKLM